MDTMLLYSEKYWHCQDIITWTYAGNGASVASCFTDPLVQIGLTSVSQDTPCVLWFYPQPACPFCVDDVMICHAVFHWEHYWLKSSSCERLLELTPFILGCACCVSCQIWMTNVAHITHKSVRFMCVEQPIMCGYPQVNQCSVCGV